MSAEEAGWATALFERSVLKQEKYRRILEMLGDVDGLTCLDIGADNGVISYLLRRRGGSWHSADLDEATVESIRRLVGENVHRIDGLRTPFPDGAFDRVVIVDFLEHIHTDAAFVMELARILRPGGTLVVNVPHIKRHSVLNRLRHAIGLTDEKHGHVRPGYSVESLSTLLGDRFHIEERRTYSKSFSEGIDTVLNGTYEVLGKLRGGGRVKSRKGTVVTKDSLEKHKTEFRMLSALYPFLWVIAQLDNLLVLQSGYKLIVRASLTPGPLGVRTPE
ncbi:MAG: class I SAM-dependent methyltransferase [Gemmatimonadota bacterium]